MTCAHRRNENAPSARTMSSCKLRQLAGIKTSRLRHKNRACLPALDITDIEKIAHIVAMDESDVL